METVLAIVELLFKASNRKIFVSSLNFKVPVFNQIFVLANHKDILVHVLVDVIHHVLPQVNKVTKYLDCLIEAMNKGPYKVKNVIRSS